MTLSSRIAVFKLGIFCPSRRVPVLLTTVTAVTLALAGSSSLADEFSLTPDYALGWPDSGAIQYSRSEQQREPPPPYSDTQTELSFKLSPGKFNFSPAGAFGLGGVFSNPRVAVRSTPMPQFGVNSDLPELHDGLSYSAGIKIEHEDEDIYGTAYVSSGQLGVSYGRLGRVWYRGLDVSLGQFAGYHPLIDTSEVLSFDLTTGLKLGWTGVGADDPLWLLSLEGNFDVQSNDGTTATGDDGDWYLNPSLFWRGPEFTFSAQLQVPVDSDFLRDFEEPDYTLKAIFEKQFK